jgi:predicted GNAT superfamily acetyltransferase
VEVVIDGRVIEVRRPRDPEEYRMISSTIAKVWGVLDSSDAVPHHVLIAADRRGGLVWGLLKRILVGLLAYCLVFQLYRLTVSCITIAT